MKCSNPDCIDGLVPDNSIGRDAGSWKWCPTCKGGRDRIHDSLEEGSTGVSAQASEGKSPGQVAYEGYHELITENDPLASDPETPLSWKELCEYDDAYRLKWENYARLIVSSLSTAPTKNTMTTENTTNLSTRCRILLQEIEKLEASHEATNLAIMASELLRAINLGEEPRGEWSEAERRFLNLPPRNTLKPDYEKLRAAGQAVADLLNDLCCEPDRLNQISDFGGKAEKALEEWESLL